MGICKSQRSVAKGDAAPLASAAPPSTSAVDIDPKLEWHDGATGYIIRFALSGFKKDDFKVQVDAGGRLTVRGESLVGHVLFHKAFQLPPAANLDGVAGRFDGTVLSLAVPKKAAAAGVAEETVVARMAEADWAAAAREREEEKGGGGFRWAESAVVGKGQMFAAAVAGFALGVFVAHRVLSVANS